MLKTVCQQKLNVTHTFTFLQPCSGLGGPGTGPHLFTQVPCLQRGEGHFPSWDGPWGERPQAGKVTLKLWGRTLVGCVGTGL